MNRSDVKRSKHAQISSRRNTNMRNHESGLNFCAWIQKINFNLIQVLKWAVIILKFYSRKCSLCHKILVLTKHVNSSHKCFKWIPEDQYRIYNFACGRTLNRIRSRIIFRREFVNTGWGVLMPSGNSWTCLRDGTV